jgi:uroporphyrinogen decarboxylase
VHRYGVDVAVLFSDIVVPLHAIGFGVDVVPGRGPVVSEPFTSETDLRRLRALEPEADIPHVIETVRLLRKELDPAACTLLGFAGGPFTVASYLVEGGPSKTFSKVKSFMYARPDLWDRLVDRLADLAIAFLAAQVHAGAEAIQLFDSWTGSLSRAQYTRFALPATRKVFAAVRELGVPGVLFGVGTGELLPLMATSGADVIGVDWRVSLGDASDRVDGLPVQGNLDPAICLAPRDVVLDAARDVIRDGAAASGHIFNLGHGVLPEADPDNLAAVVELVHSEGLDLRLDARAR